MTEPFRYVLVVEDDADVAGMVSHVLERAGYDVIAASSGADALAFLMRAPGRCLILLDLNMHDMNGWEVMSELQEARHLDHRVIIMSGLPLDKFPRGVAALRKPFSAEQLLSAVAAASQVRDEQRQASSARG